MAELFPGNSQMADFWNHDKGAFFSQGTLNAAGIGLRLLTPDSPFLNDDGRNVANLVGKRPAEYANNPNYTIHGGAGDRFITVIDKSNGFVEAFYDKQALGGVFQLANKPLPTDSLAYYQRQQFYKFLGANLPHGGR